MMQQTSLSNKRALISLSLLGAVIPTVILIALVLMRTGGVWEYALDDVYIHLSMSDQISKGGYGVNDGEYASASSSVLYSYLLVPFAGFEWQVWWPLVLGLTAMLGAAVLWGKLLARAHGNASPIFGVCLLILAFTGPMILHFPAMSIIGMEHMLHILVTLMALLGLLDFAKTGRIGWLLIVGVVFNPILRFEGMSIAIVASAVVFFSGRKLAGLALLGAAFLPLVAHFILMTNLGLDLLPNSVNAKAAVTGGGAAPEGAAQSDRLARIKLTLLFALASPSGRALMFAIVIMAVSLILARRHFSNTYRLIGWMAVLVATGHVVLGLTVLFYRYEVYAWTFIIGAGAVLLSQVRFQDERLSKMLPVLFTICVIYGGIHYPISSVRNIPDGSVGIYSQQRQMGRFVDDHWKAPVAVNDLGHVAFQNPYYVLDLWGLASSEALEARLRGSEPMWADKLAREHDVDVAMIYRTWLHDDIPANWIRVADLRLLSPRGTLGGDVVSFYATRPEIIDKLKTDLTDFAIGLPPTAELKLVTQD